MEVIDDWPSVRQQAPAAAQGGAAPGPLPTPEAIGRRIAALQLGAVQLNCYVDVGYLWVQVAFDELISPAVALRVGQALEELAGPQQVLLNSLRPQAVFFVLATPAQSPPPDLAASRYGTVLREIQAAWAQPAPTASLARGRARVRAAT